MRTLLVLVISLVTLGCGDNERPQVLTGRVGTGFPADMATVRVVHGSYIIASSPIATDGSFRLVVRAGQARRLQLVGSAFSDVVFPRQLGGIDRTFRVRRGGGPFDLGALHFIGDSTLMPFVFKTIDTEQTDCEDGHDANGAACVEDDDEQGDSCDNDDGDDSEHEGGADVAEVDDAPDAGDSTADHNFPSDGCNGDDEEDDD